MAPFWTQFFEQIGRSARGASFNEPKPFIISLLALAAVGLLAAAVSIDALRRYVAQSLLFLGAALLLWFLFALYRARQRRRASARFGPLSRDELRVARSKLVKDRTVR
jgi:hypothetical protein